MTDVSIRDARPADAARLTEVAQAAKRRWNYPPEWMERWTDALTISAGYLGAHRVFVGEAAGIAIAVCALERRDGGWWLEHVWVDPAAQGGGIGRAMVEHALAAAAALDPGIVMVQSDPNAVGFYERLGADVVGSVPAPMPGAPGRVLRTLQFTVPRRP